MSLTHRITSIRPYQEKYLLSIEVTDDVSGMVYTPPPFSLPSSPNPGEQESWATIAKDRIQQELDYKANGMNLISDEDRLLEYYRGIKEDIVRRIRAVPGATAQQAKDYIAGRYPDSPFDFDELYAIWIGMIDVSTWDNFKVWVRDHKFREID